MLDTVEVNGRGAEMLARCLAFAILHNSSTQSTWHRGGKDGGPGTETL